MSRTDVTLKVPNSAVAGSKVLVTIGVKNRTSATGYFAVAGMFDSQRFINMEQALIDAGKTKDFKGSFTMPSKDIEVHGISYYPDPESRFGWATDAAFGKRIKLAVNDVVLLARRDVNVGVLLDEKPPVPKEVVLLDRFTMDIGPTQELYLLDKKDAMVSPTAMEVVLLDSAEVQVKTTMDVVLLDTYEIVVSLEEIGVILLDSRDMVVEAIVEDEEEEEEPEPEKINWWLWGGIAAVAVIIAIVIARRRG